MRMGKQAKFSLCERKFVCQHKMARDCEPVMQLVHHILYGGHGEDKLPKFYFQLAFDFLEGVSSHFVPATGRKVFLLVLLRMKGRIETMQYLHNIIQ